MSRLDDAIRDLTGANVSRRRFLRRAAALGLTLPAWSLAGGSGARADVAKGEVVWVSSRGTIDVLDNYPYWVALANGYFGDLQTQLLPDIFDASSTAKAVAGGEADVTNVAPGVFVQDVASGDEIVSVFQLGAYDTFDIAVPKGNPTGVQTAKELEGRKLAVADIGWTAIVDPLVAQAGGDPAKVQYVSAGTSWGQALATGQADAALAWEGLRAQWAANGLDFDYVLGKSWSKFPSSSFQIRAADLENAALADLYGRYLRGWAMGLEFGHHNPRAAAQITMAAAPVAKSLQSTFPDKKVAVDALWQLAGAYRGDWNNRDGGKWGYADLDGWKLLVKTLQDIHQLTKDLSVDDIVSNDLIAAANDFNHEQVKAAAAAFTLSPEFAAVAEPAGAGSDGSYP